MNSLIHRAGIVGSVLVLSGCTVQGPSAQFVPWWSNVSKQDFQALASDTEQGFRLLTAKVNCISEGKKFEFTNGKGRCVSPEKENDTQKEKTEPPK